MALRIGDEVTWTSQSSGLSSTKTGTIIGVIPPGKLPFYPATRFLRGNRKNRLRPLYARRSAGYSQKPLSDGPARKKVSYLIAAENEVTGDKGVYWPRAEALVKL